MARTFTTLELCKILGVDGGGLNKLFTDLNNEGRKIVPLKKNEKGETVYGEEAMRALRFEHTGEREMPESFLEFYNKKREGLEQEEQARLDNIRADFAARRANLAEQAAEDWVLGHKNMGAMKFSQLCAKVSEDLKRLTEGGEETSQGLRLTPTKKRQFANQVFEMFKRNPDRWMTAGEIFQQMENYAELVKYWDPVRKTLLNEKRLIANDGQRHMKAYKLAQGE